MRRKLIASAVSTVSLAATLLASTSVPTFAAVKHDQAQMNTPFAHIYVIMMENEGSRLLVGNPDLPYINSLIQNDGYDPNYYGVTHESLANYVSFISGSNWGTHSDDPTQVFNHINLVDQLSKANISWKGYMENLPSVGYKGYWFPDNLPSNASPSQTPPNALYALKHNPFSLMADVVDNPTRNKNVVPLTQLQRDLNNNTVPNFSFITPNVINDMHGQPPGPGATVTWNDTKQLFQAGDNFVKNTVQEITSSKSWKTSKSVIYITWDEADYPFGNVTPSQLATFTTPGPDAPIVPAGTVDGYTWPGGAYGGGNVPLIIVDNAAKGHFTVNTWADHYSLLRTIEKNWNLGYINNASDSNQVKSINIPGEPK